MNDNQWVRLSADHGLNMALLVEARALDDGSFRVVRMDGMDATYRDDEAARLRTWLRDQYLPILRT